MVKCSPALRIKFSADRQFCVSKTPTFYSWKPLAFVLKQKRPSNGPFSLSEIMVPLWEDTQCRIRSKNFIDGRYECGGTHIHQNQTDKRNFIAHINELPVMVLRQCNFQTVFWTTDNNRNFGKAVWLSLRKI